MFKNLIDTERLIHSFKAAIACLIGIFLINLIGAPGDQWVVITIIVVMCAQIYVGSVIKKAYLRFLGTLIGCLFAAITLTTLGDTNIAIIIAITLSSFIFSYLATGKEDMVYAGTLGAVTTALIMLGQHPTILFAAQRFLEISVGIFIAALVSQYILPIPAGKHLRRSQARTLEQLRDYYIAAMRPNLGKKKYDYQELDERIVQSLLKQRQLAKESAAEPSSYGFRPLFFMQSLYCEREMLRAITFMHSALTRITKSQLLIDERPEAHLFHETFIQSLNTIIKVLGSSKPQDHHIHVPSLKELRELRDQVATPEDGDLIYVDGFLFSAEILLVSLRKLAELFKIPVYDKTA